MQFHLFMVLISDFFLTLNNTLLSGCLPFCFCCCLFTKIFNFVFSFHFSVVHEGHLSVVLRESSSVGAQIKLCPAFLIYVQLLKDIFVTPKF